MGTYSRHGVELIKYIKVVLSMPLPHRTNINVTLIDMFKVLDLDLDEPLFTIDILKAHMVRLVLALVTPFVFMGHQWNKFVDNIVFFVTAIIWMSSEDVQRCAGQPKTDGVLSWCNNNLCYYLGYAWAIPRNIGKLKTATTGPKGLRSLQHVMPRLEANSVACIYEYAPLYTQKPPGLPQPYLNADKEWIEPSEQELNEAKQLQEAYDNELEKSQATETSQFHRHMGKLVTWMCLNSTVSELVFFERTGTLGRSRDQIKEAIFISLAQLICFCDPSEMQDFSRLIPKIIVDIGGVREDLSTQYATLGLTDANPAREFVVKCMDGNIEDKAPKPSELITVMSPETKLFGYYCKSGEYDPVIVNCTEFTFASLLRAIIIYSMNGEGRGRL